MQASYEVDIVKCLSKFVSLDFLRNQRQKYEHVFVRDKVKNKYKDLQSIMVMCIFHYIFFSLAGKGKSFYKIYIYPVIF